MVKAAWTESCREGVGPRDPAPSWGSPASASVSSLFSSGTPPLGVPPLPPKLLVLTMALSVGFVPLTSGGILGWLSVPRAEEGTFMRTRGTHGEAFLSGVLCGVLRSVLPCPVLCCPWPGASPPRQGPRLHDRLGTRGSCSHSFLLASEGPSWLPAVWSPGFIQMRPRGHCLWSPLLPAGSKLVLFKFNVLSLGGDKISVTFMPHTRKCFALWRRQCRLWFFGAGLVDLDLLTA